MANQFVARKGLIALDDSQITGSLDVSGSISASVFSGDGSGLSGVSDFPYTGSAVISGSLNVIGDITGSGNVLFDIPGGDGGIRIGNDWGDYQTINWRSNNVGFTLGAGGSLIARVGATGPGGFIIGNVTNNQGTSATLDVRGNAVITGSNSLAGSYALKVANSSGTDLIKAENDGTVELNDKVFINGTNISPLSGYALNVSESVNIRGVINFDNSSHQAWIKTANNTQRAIKIPGTGGHGYFQFYNTNGNGIQLLNSSAGNSTLTLRSPSVDGNNSLIGISQGSSLGYGGGYFIYYDSTSNKRIYTFGNLGSEGVGAEDGTSVRLTASPAGTIGTRKGGNVYIISTPGSSGGIDGKVYITGSTEITGSLNVIGDITGSNISASTYYGDGSNLTGIDSGSWDGIFTGSAEITGSLEVTGSIETTSNLGVNGIGSFGNNQFLIGSNVPSNAVTGFNSTFEFQNGPTTYSSQLVFRPKGNQVNYNQSSWGWIRFDPQNVSGLSIYAANYRPNIVFGRGIPSSTNPPAFAKLNDSGLKLQSSYMLNIGTAEERLHVVGNGKFTGFITASGNLITEANITASGHISASTYYGDGSNLTGISSDPFPYTGSAIISGSLEVIGDITGSGKIDLNDGNNNVLISTGNSTINTSNTVAIGEGALQNITTGASNTAVGYQASYSLTTGQQNTTFGYQAGKSNTTGTTNTFIGFSAGLSNTFASANTYVGSQAGQYATSNGSTGVGVRANYNVSGIYNTGVGYSANDQVVTGQRNSALGAFSNNFSNGSYNVAVGYEALKGVQSTSTFSNTVAIGYQAGTALTTGGNNILIGYQAGSTLTTESNKLYIDNSNTSTPLIYGEFDTNKVLINGELSASSAISASTYYGDGSNLTGISGGGSTFPYTGSAVISGSLEVIGNITGSLSIEGSGSTLFEVNGSEGQLFSITDSLSGSLFAVSDVSGLPILEVFSDDTVKIGSFNNEAITVNGSTAVVTGSFTGSFVGDGSNLTGIDSSDFSNLPTSDPNIAGRLFQTSSDAIGASAGFQVVLISQG